jgi:hypothetical protein
MALGRPNCKTPPCAGRARNGIFRIPACPAVDIGRDALAAEAALTAHCLGENAHLETVNSSIANEFNDHAQGGAHVILRKPCAPSFADNRGRATLECRWAKNRLPLTAQEVGRITGAGFQFECNSAFWLLACWSNAAA